MTAERLTFPVNFYNYSAVKKNLWFQKYSADAFEELSAKQENAPVDAVRKKELTVRRFLSLSAVFSLRARYGRCGRKEKTAFFLCADKPSLRHPPYLIPYS